MGIKNIKLHYGINHNIEINDKGICIGSAFIHDIIVVKPNGVCVQRYDNSGNKDLSRYQAEIDANPSLFKELFERPDEFTNSIPVYTYSGSTIIEKFCEKVGWPNTTHDGLMMYENMYSTDKNTVVAWAKNSANLKFNCYLTRIEDVKKNLQELEEVKASAESDLKSLEAEYPSVKDEISCE